MSWIAPTLRHWAAAAALSFASLAVATSTAHAEEWHHARLEADDGSRISLDFRAVGLHAGTFVTAPLWVNVQHSRLGADDKVAVRITERWHDDTGMRGPVVIEDVLAFPLSYAGGGRFTAAAPSTLRIIPTVGWSEQVVEVAVNGHALRDPVSRRDAFQVSLRDAAGPLP